MKKERRGEKIDDTKQKSIKMMSNNPIYGLQQQDAKRESSNLSQVRDEVLRSVAGVKAADQRSQKRKRKSFREFWARHSRRNSGSASPSKGKGNRLRSQSCGDELDVFQEQHQVEGELDENPEQQEPKLIRASSLDPQENIKRPHR